MVDITFTAPDSHLQLAYVFKWNAAHVNIVLVDYVFLEVG